MADVKVLLPKLGESILSATIVQWFKEEGDSVEVDEPLLEVSTDKLNSEIPSPVKGTIKKIHAKVDQELNVGDLLVEIQTGEDIEKKRGALKKEEKPLEEKKIEESGAKPSKCKIEKNRKIFLSPVAKILVEKNNISPDELEMISPTGAGGRVSRKDIEDYLKRAKDRSFQLPRKQGLEKTEAIKMSPMRKTIAKNMVKSSQEIPSGSLIIEIDVTDVLKFIKDIKEDFLKKNGFKITITSFLLKAIAKALKDSPLVNATLIDDTVYIKKDINIGLAVNIESGLIVPVIKNAESKLISELARDVFLLGEKARKSKLASDDIEGGTITMTNFGMGGALIGIPIIKYPEAAIIGIGTIVKKVVVLDDDSFAVRSIINVSLTFDHRIIDGMYGSNFMQRFKSYIEKEAIADFS